MCGHLGLCKNALAGERVRRSLGPGVTRGRAVVGFDPAGVLAIDDLISAAGDWRRSGKCGGGRVGLPKGGGRRVRGEEEGVNLSSGDPLVAA